MSISNNTDALLVQLLSASTRRHEVLTNNLANQNTPGFKRQTLQFEDLLAQELQERKPDLLSVEPLLVEDELTPSSPDGNNVNLELEMTGIQQNRLQYELYSALLSGRAELLRTAIQDGR